MDENFFLEAPYLGLDYIKSLEKEEKYNVTSTDESISSSTDQWDNSQFIPQFQPLDVSTIICGVDDNDKEQEKGAGKETDDVEDKERENKKF